MTDALKEQLSACLDDELSRAELDLLLKRTGRDASLSASLGRYALISAALRGERPVIASRDFAANVMAAVAREPASAPVRRVAPGLARRLRPVAGLAVAASVAAITVISVQRTGEAPEQVASQHGAPVVVSETPAGPTGPRVDDRLAEAVTSPASIDAADSYTVPDPATAAVPAFLPATRLTNYVVAHSEYSSPLGRRSVLTGVLADDDSDPTKAEDAEAAAAQPRGD